MSLGIAPKRAVERCEQLAIIGPPPAWYRPILLRRWLRLYRSIMALDISEVSEMLRSIYTPEHIIELANRPNLVAGMLARHKDPS